MSNSRFTYMHDCGHYFLSHTTDYDGFLRAKGFTYKALTDDAPIDRLAQRIVAVGRGDHVATMKEHGRTVTALLHAVVGLLQKAKD